MKVDYVLLNEKESQDIKGWDEFYKKYPNSPGIISVSRVGFNKEKNQAVVYVGLQSDYLAGRGVIFLLEKKDNSWQIKKQTLLWIS